MDGRVELIVDLIKEYEPDRIPDLDEIAKILEERDRSGIGPAADQIGEILRKISVRDPSTMTFEEFEQYIHRKFGI